LPALSKAEQEVVIGKTADATEWTIYSTDPKWTRHFTKLTAKVGGRVSEHQGGTKVFLPEDSLFIGGKRKLTLTPEQRAQRADRMRARRQAQAA
jgi:hypothetical protein